MTPVLARAQRFPLVVALFVACLARMPLAGAEPAPAIVAAPGFELAEVTIEQLQTRMQAGELTAQLLAAAYLARIAAIDRSGPNLRSIIEINPDAPAIAAQLDAERVAGKVRGPLHGIPVLLKDNIATADRMETTAGSLALVGSRPPRDAALVARLREAGAVILGKTNLSEWANFRSDRSVSGWSGRGGQTRHPHALDRNPSGSSSGSAVAISANLCALAVGTETVGSIVAPASACGIVGVKPTVGLVSRAGIIPISSTQDTAGPMTRTVRDAAILLGVLAGGDPHDAITATRPADMSLDFLAALRPGALRGARLGVMPPADWIYPRLAALRERTLDSLRTAGAEIVEVPEPKVFDELWPAEELVLSYEFKDGINAWFAGLQPEFPVKSLADLIAFNEAHADRELAIFDQGTLIAAEARGPLTEAAYIDARALAWRLARDVGIDASMTEHRLDALVDFTAGPAWLIDPVTGDKPNGANAIYPLAAVAGYPSITVPAVEDRGLPVGLTFVGRAWSEGRLLALAADFEANVNARRQPGFLPTVLVPGAAGH